MADYTNAERQRRFRENRKKRDESDMQLAVAAMTLSTLIRNAADAEHPLALEIRGNNAHDTIKNLQEYFLEAAPIATASRKRSTKTK